MDLKVIGKGVPKYDAWGKARGEIIYADDFSLPGMLYGKVFRSPYPRAKILEINVEKALKIPGVHAVITHKDVPRNNLKARFGQGTEIGAQFEGLYRVLAEGEVRYFGEPLALIAAETLEIAEKACELIEAKLEPLPGVFDPLDAMQPGAPQVGEKENNIASRFKIRKGDVEKGFQEAEVIVEGFYKVGYQDHAYLEPESGVAWVDDDGTIVIRVSSQVIEHFREVAEVLDLPHSKVRYIGTLIGGGFGGKEDITVESYLALLAWKTRRPVKLTYTRKESLLVHSKRHPYYMFYKTGATRDGRITAVQVKLVSDAGSYAALSPWVLLYSTVDAVGPYQVENVKVDSYTVMTNTPITSAFRGFGAPQVNFAYESQMNELAKKLRMDPLELRKRNFLKQGNSLSTGYVYDRPVPLDVLADKAWEALGPRRESHNPDIKIGRGLAVGMCSYGRLTFLHDTSRSYVRLELDGSAVIRCGVPDVGGGQGHILSQIVSEELGVPLERIKIHVTDSQLTPLAGTTTATRQLYMSGNATLKAAKELKRRMLNKAAQILAVKEEELEVGEGRIFLRSDPSRYIALVPLINRMSGDGEELFVEAQFNAPFSDVPEKEIIEGRTFPDFTFGAYAVEVEVDEKTGQVRLTRIVGAYDVGKALNPILVEGQMEGGAVQGAGYALLEEMTIKDGIVQTPSFQEYLIPTSLDVPDVETIMMESGTGLGPYGAKGIGEPPIVGIAPAIVNAIDDAVGVRITSLPATSEKILLALKEKREK
ncbi:MAG: xanthine dehydrogenase family protein molybdopterin-binding subunit [Caldiserica bacterium]|jgi:CO/xanthine dehydrogenase Mo-binding subunit|nr:xanthine dehydrogenase family protein molybdopterin-binding subunit [Caldisericota bacterium]MDH7563046.1 xanthine dehydrogenase family protein molybdopterin-binding subunit [Caldisericota bacterium]